MDNISIFVSSTYEDLKLHRENVIKVIQMMELIPVAMENFTSVSCSSIENCLSKLDKCHLYVGIIGMRYGSIDTLSGMSITELEYNRAKEKKIPMLVFLINPDEATIKPCFVDRGSAGEKLEQFKKKILDDLQISFFTTPDNLASLVAPAIHNELKKLNIHGRQIQISEAVESVVNDFSAQNATVILRRFNILPEHWKGVKIKIKINNSRNGRVIDPCQFDEAEDYFDTNEVVWANWYIEEYGQSMQIIAIGNMATEMIDIKKPSIITAIVETVIYENRWGDIRNPYCKALKLISIGRVEEQSVCVEVGENELEDDFPF